MNNIRVEMYYYQVVKQYVVMVLFDDEQGESCSINSYFTSKRKAEKELAALRVKYAC